MKREAEQIFFQHTGEHATTRQIRAALAKDEERRRGAVFAYLDGESTTAIAKQLGISGPGVWSLLRSSMRACYRRIYGATLPALHPGRPSREGLRTGYRKDSKRHKAAAKKRYSQEGK